MFGRLWRWLSRPRPLYYQRRILSWEFPSIRRKHIVTGAMAMPYFYLVSGLFFAPFVRALGASRAVYGILIAAGMGAVGLQIFSAIWTHHLGHRKRIWLVFSLLARGIRGIGLAVSFLLYANGLPGAVWVLGISLIVSNFCHAMALPPWMSWLADLVPQEEHASFLGRRQAWQALATASLVLPAAVFLDVLPVGMKITGRMFVFGFATALGLLDIIIHRTIPEPYMARSENGHRFRSALEPLRDRRLRPWLWFRAAWQFSMMFVGSTLMIYFAEDLRLEQGILGGAIVLIILPMVLTMSLSNHTGKWIDRFGVRRVLYACHVGWAFLPVLWIAATPRSALLILAVTQTLGSTWFLLSNLAANKIATRVPPEHSRPMYVAVTALVGSAGAAFGGWAGAGATSLLEGVRGEVLGFSYVGYHIVLLASLAMRLASLLLIRSVPEPDAEGGS